MDGGAREEHAGSDRMPQPLKLDCDASDESLLGKCMLNTVSFDLRCDETEQNSKSDATDDALPGIRSLNSVSSELENNETEQNPDSDATDEALLSNSSLNSMSIELQGNETAQSSDSDPTDEALLGNRCFQSVSSELGSNETSGNPNLNPNLEDNEEALQMDIKGSNWSELCDTMRRTATLFAAQYRETMIKRLKSDGSSSLSDAGGKDHPPGYTDEKLDTLSVMNQAGIIKMIEQFNDLYVEGDAESAPADKKDEILLSLVIEIKDLQRQIKERKVWANQKALQAARKLSHDLTELKMLRMEKEENQRIRQGKPTAEDSNMKRLSEIETALMKANDQQDRADLAVRFLELDNAAIRAEIEASKLSASESMAMCLEVAMREKNYLKKFSAWQKQREKLQEDITFEKQKLIELQEEMDQVEAAKKTAEAKWREEKKAKEHALAQIEEEKCLREATEANRKRNQKTLRSKIELDFQLYKDDLQRFVQELSHIKTITNPYQHSSNSSASGSQHETFANLIHESDNLDEKEDVIDRECTICSEDEVSVLFLPCAHQVLCASCNDMFMKNGIEKCPACRVLIEQKIRVFGTSS